MHRGWEIISRPHSRTRGYDRDSAYPGSAVMTSDTPGRRRVGAAALIAASALASSDLFIANLAFPAITAHFDNTSPSTLSWVLNSYVVVLASMMIPAGVLADRLGRKRLFQIGLALHIVGAIAAATAPSAGVLIAARGLQGAGAAVLVPTSMGLLLDRYPVERHKQMVAVWAAAGSVAAGAGPVLGGIVAEVDWRWVFVLTLPLSLSAIIATRALTETERQKAALPDMVGAAMVVLALGGLVTSLALTRTDAGMVTIAFFAALAVIALVSLVIRCRTHPRPILRPSMFRVSSFSFAAVGMALYHVGFTGVLLGGSLFLVTVWGWGTAAAGAAFAVGPITAAIAALLAGRFAITPRTMTLVGGAALSAVGVLFLGLLVASPVSVPVFLIGMVLWGVSAGFCQAGMLAGGLAELGGGDYSAGSAVLNTTRQAGSAIGNALIVVIVGAGGIASTFSTVWLVTIVGGLATVLVGVALQRSARRT